MGVRLTGHPEVAMFDSVTGRAFGPVFEDAIEAQEFLYWLERAGWRDARLMTVTQLEAEYGAYVKQRDSE